MLTYMSIYDEITRRVKEERLFLLNPAMPKSLVVRKIYVSSEIKSLLLGPWSERSLEVRCGYLRADIDRYIEGQLLAIAASPYKGKTSYMKQLDPPRDEVWEIRSRDPKPGIRLFGRFSEKDVFIALSWHERSNLKGPGSRQWRDAKEECKSEWRKLFPTYQPLMGNNINEYLTNNFLV